MKRMIIEITTCTKCPFHLGLQNGVYCQPLGRPYMSLNIDKEICPDCPLPNEAVVKSDRVKIDLNS